VQISRHRDQDFHLGYDSQTVGRLLILILLIVLAAWLVRRALRRAAPPADVPSAQKTDELVRCAQCGVLLPRAEARLSAGAIYCSEEHARLGPGPR
jgi:uncharacterized protein